MLAQGLDALVSISFLFFLFALLVSGVMEAISSVLKLRGPGLMVALEMLLDETPGDKRANGRGGFGMMDWVSGNRQTRTDGTESVFERLFRGSLIGGLKPGAMPSYVSPDEFALGLLAALKGDRIGEGFADIAETVRKLPDGRLKTTLLTLIADTGGDYDKLKKGISGWFDSAMMRLSGEYKRFTQLITFIIALGLALTLNVDAVRVGERLLRDPGLAAATADAATDYVKRKQDEAEKAAAKAEATQTDDAIRKALQARVEAVRAADETLSQNFPFVGYGEKQTVVSAAKEGWPVLGWLIMALTAVVGAPFWFDLLQRFVNLRGAGPKPDGRTPGDGK